MTIAFDGSRALIKDRTGTENYSYQLLKALSKIDSKNQYVVYLRSSTHPGTAWRGWPDNFQFKVIKWPRLWTQAGLAKQTFRDKLDVLFIPAHTSPLIHKPGLKTVVTVHDLGAEFLPGHHQIKQALYLKWITHYQLKHATRLIAVSKATKDDLVKRVKINPNKVDVVYEGYDENLFKQVKGDKLVNGLKQFDLEAGKYFLFVGTIQPRKNLERLINAFYKMVSRGQAHLVIAGGKGWKSERIYELPKKLGIEDKVKFLGRVDDHDLPTLYSEAIALVFPSLFEGFGLPILEAQACGCPVMTSNISSTPEVAGKGAILVDPYSVDDIVDGMSELTREKGKAKREKLVEAGFENVKRFSWENCAKETLKVLEEVGSG